MDIVIFWLQVKFPDLLIFYMFYFEFYLIIFNNNLSKISNFNIFLQGNGSMNPLRNSALSLISNFRNIKRDVKTLFINVYFVNWFLLSFFFFLGGVLWLFCIYFLQISCILWCRENLSRFLLMITERLLVVSASITVNCFWSSVDGAIYVPCMIAHLQWVFG